MTRKGTEIIEIAKAHVAANPNVKIDRRKTVVQTVEAHIRANPDMTFDQLWEVVGEAQRAHRESVFRSRSERAKAVQARRKAAAQPPHTSSL